MSLSLLDWWCCNYGFSSTVSPELRRRHSRKSRRIGVLRLLLSNRHRRIVKENLGGKRILRCLDTYTIV
jgi:hypothetical protein